MPQEKTRAQLTRRGLKSLDRVDLFQRGEPTHEASEAKLHRIAML
jgi:hypothetical protein